MSISLGGGSYLRYAQGKAAGCEDGDEHKVMGESYQEPTLPCDSAGCYLGHVLREGLVSVRAPRAILWSHLAKS